MTIIKGNGGLHKVKVESLGVPYAKVSLDGNPIKAARLDVHMEVGSVPETEISFWSDPELDLETLVTVDLTPKTVKSAVDVLKAALMRNDFVAFMGMSDLNKLMGEKH